MVSFLVSRLLRGVRCWVCICIFQYKFSVIIIIIIIIIMNALSVKNPLYTLKLKLFLRSDSKLIKSKYIWVTGEDFWTLPFENLVYCFLLLFLIFHEYCLFSVHMRFFNRQYLLFAFYQNDEGNGAVNYIQFLVSYNQFEAGLFLGNWNWGV